MEWNFQQILDFKAVVRIRLYALGNLGVKVEEEDWQAPGSPQADSCPLAPFSWVSLVHESVQVALPTPERPALPQVTFSFSFFFNAKATMMM